MLSKTWNYLLKKYFNCFLINNVSLNLMLFMDLIHIVQLNAYIFITFRLAYR